MIEPYEKCLWGGSAKGRKCMRRFFIEGSCQVGDQLTLKETDSKHFAHVLRDEWVTSWKLSVTVGFLWLW